MTTTSPSQNRRAFLLALLLASTAAPVAATPRDDLIRTLNETRTALASGTLGYAAYLKLEDQLSTAFDAAYYSKTRLPKGTVESVRFILKQMRTLERAWTLRYTLGIAGGEPVATVGFYDRQHAKVQNAFFDVDRRIRLADHAVSAGEDGNGAFTVYAFDRMVRLGFEAINRSIAISLTRFR